MPGKNGEESNTFTYEIYCSGNLRRIKSSSLQTSLTQRQNIRGNTIKTKRL